MAKQQTQETKSKRQQIREQRARKARQQRFIIVGGIVLVVAIVIGLVVVPAIIRNNTPVGDFTLVTPQNLEKSEGLTVGDPNAPVKIEVFEDFKCSACQGYNSQIEAQVISELVDTGKAYYIFRNYPFLDDGSTVKDSDSAANAAMCASEQNRFWDYHHILFANLNYVLGEFSNKRLEAFADSLGLDMNKFSQCLENRTYQDQIDADLALGKEMGVSGTPSIFVNGTIIKPGYVPSFEDISAAVEAELAK